MVLTTQHPETYRTMSVLGITMVLKNPATYRTMSVLGIWEVYLSCWMSRTTQPLAEDRSPDRGCPSRDLARIAWVSSTSRVWREGTSSLLHPTIITSTTCRHASNALRFKLILRRIVFRSTVLFRIALISWNMECGCDAFHTVHLSVVQFTLSPISILINKTLHC